MRIAGVIPARYGSSRFPGKPLALLDGKPMIVHVCEQAVRAQRLDAVWVATDDNRIADAVRAAGFEARITPSDCATGSDRIVASLAAGEAWDILVNIQGDEPKIDPAVIDQVTAALIDNPACGISTAAVPITTRNDFESTNIVKVVLNQLGQALYFSRAPLPSLARIPQVAQAAADFPWGLKHLGLYAYRRDVLMQFSTWPQTPLEQRECLEQLRLLENGIQIQVAVVTHDSIGVDTPEELAALNSLGAGT